MLIPKIEGFFLFTWIRNKKLPPPLLFFLDVTQWIRTNVKNLAISDAAIVQSVSERIGGGLSRFSILNGASFSMTLPNTAEGCSIFLDSDDGELSIASSTVQV